MMDTIPMHVGRWALGLWDRRIRFDMLLLNKNICDIYGASHIIILSSSRIERKAFHGRYRYYLGPSILIMQM